MNKFFSQLPSINTFIFDVDGVLTNGQILVTEEGQLLRSMNIKDGYALKLAVEKGYHVCIISGGKSEGVKIRLEKLGIKEVFIGVGNKVKVFEDFITKYNIDLNTIVYMGDDMPDLEVMQKVGIPCCPEDAVPEIKQLSTYISPFKGGEGCVRDIVEKVLKVRGHWA